MNEEIHTEQKKTSSRWVFANFFGKGAVCTLILSIAIFTLYMIGSLPDPGFSDQLLFFLLQILQYSSLMLCVFAFFATGFRVHQLVHNPSLRNAILLLLYFLAGLFGASLVTLNSFIIAASTGNI